MSTKNETTQNNSYAPHAMQGYQTALNTANNFVKNPYSNPFYQQTLAQGVNAANAMNQTAQSNTNAYISGSGIGVNSPAAQMLRQMGGYQGSHNTANAFLNASGQAQQMFGMGMNMMANPLVTGAKGTQQTSGLGTWLPQVIGAGVGAAAGGFAGGKGFSMGNMFKGMAGMPVGGNSMGGSVGMMPMTPSSGMGFTGAGMSNPFAPYNGQ